MSYFPTVAAGAIVGNWVHGVTTRVLELSVRARWQPEALTVGFDHRYAVSSGPANLWLAREDVFMAFTEAFLMVVLVDLG